MQSRLDTMLDIETPLAGSLAPQTPFSAEPTFTFKTKGFDVRNYGEQYAYPPRELQPGLEEVIIFTENNKKANVPNGSVWIYNGSGYDPRILRDDVGCGIAFFVTESLDINQDLVRNLVNYIHDTNIRIGRGNHFITIANKHPLAKESNLLAIHSDFNPGQVMPLTYAAAQRRQAEARERRRELGEQLLAKTSITGTFLNDFPHNTVTQEDGKTVYAKGAIHLPQKADIGVLALNPFDGFYFYSSDWASYHGFMQHGTGKKRNGAMRLEPTAKRGRVQAYQFSGRPDGLYDEFNTIDSFNKAFMQEQSCVGYASNKVVIRTS